MQKSTPVRESLRSRDQIEQDRVAEGDIEKDASEAVEHVHRIDAKV